MYESMLSGYRSQLPGKPVLTVNQANCNRLLNVARETYKENVGDIMQLTDTLRAEHDIPVQSIYQDSGFVFCVKKADLEGGLPPGFINVLSKGAKYYFSSVELVFCDLF